MVFSGKVGTKQAVRALWVELARLVWQIMQGPRTHHLCNALTLNNLRKASVRGPNF